MKRTVIFTALQDDGIFDGHDFELVYDDSRGWDGRIRAFETIRSIGDAPLSTSAVITLVELCAISDDILKAIQLDSHFTDETVSRSDVDDVCTEIGQNKFIVLDTDYSSLETAA